jgi:hypothetical protein
VVAAERAETVEEVVRRGLALERKCSSAESEGDKDCIILFAHQ